MNCKEKPFLLPKKSATWLVTGGAGFIGSHIVSKLLNLNQNVICMDNFYSGKSSNLQREEINALEFKEKLTIFEGDIRSYDDCLKAMHGVDFVIHQAAIVNVDLSFKKPRFVHDVNSTGFLNILHAAQTFGIKRVVYASSSSVYGQVSACELQESMIPKPFSPYAISKYINELHAALYTEKYGMEVTGLRYFNIYGPYQSINDAYSAVIPIWVARILGNLSPVVYGDGMTVRDFCYVEDVVTANLNAALLPYEGGQKNRVFNIGSGKKTSLIDLYAHLKSALGSDCKELIFAPPKQGDIRFSLASISQAQEVLGFIPRYDIQDGLNQTIAYYRKILALKGNVNFV